MTDKLIEYMKEHDMFDTDEGQKHRRFILGKLNELMIKWIGQVSIEKVCMCTCVHMCMCVHACCYLVNSYRENQKMSLKSFRGKSSLLDRTVWGYMEKANKL